MDDNKRKLIHFNSSILSEKNDDLYNIISKYPGYSLILLESTITILNLIVSSKISPVGKKTLLTGIINKITGIDQKTVRIIIDMIINLKFIEDEDDIFVLSPYGKLFLMSDTVSQQVDLIKYFWEKADWGKLIPENYQDKFIITDARRYIACMLSRVNNEKFKYCSGQSFPEGNSLKGLDIIYNADYTAFKELLCSKSIGFVLKNVFEQIGFLAYNNDSKTGEFNLSQMGKEILEYYSCGMIDEYRQMIDECWDSYDRGNFQEAFDNALSIVKIAGIIPEALNVIGCVYIKKNEYDAAEEVFNYALDMCSNNAMDRNIKKGFYAETYISIYYNLGLCCVSMGEFFRALHIFNSIKKTFPYNLESLDKITREVKKLVTI